MGNFPGQLGSHPRLGQTVHQRRCRREQFQLGLFPSCSPHIRGITLTWSHTASQRGKKEMLEHSSASLVPATVSHERRREGTVIKREEQISWTCPLIITIIKVACMQFCKLKNNVTFIISSTCIITTEISYQEHRMYSWMTQVQILALSLSYLASSF